MTQVRRVPPGRAGRLWLVHRLAVAERGADLLDQKLRILHAERQRLTILTERTKTHWQARSREATQWLLRATLLGGQRSVRLATDEDLVDVALGWTQMMGVRYPVDSTCSWPASDRQAAPCSQAIVEAREAHRRALEAGVEHAMSAAALRVVEAEEAATRRRLRAIQDRWMPRLQEALAEIRLGLEEQEHAEGVRLRWAADRRDDVLGSDANEARR